MTSDIELIEYGTPFSYDHRNKELFVTYNDFSFVVKEDMDNLCYYVYTWIKSDKKLTKANVIDFLDDCQAKRRYFSEYKLEKYTLSCTIKKEANTGLNTVNLNIFTKDLSKWLAENMYLSCCAKCGEEADIFLDHIDGKALVICNDCKHGRAKVFIDPTTPAPKAASKPEVDIFDLSDLIPPDDVDDDLSDFADEAVLPVSDKDNEKPDLDRFEAVSLDDTTFAASEQSLEEASIPSVSAESSDLKQNEQLRFDDIVTPEKPIVTEAPAAETEKSLPTSASSALKPSKEPSFDKILTPAAEEKPKSAEQSKPAARNNNDDILFEDMLTPVAEEKPVEMSKPAAQSKSAGISFEDMLTPVAVQKPAEKPKPAAKSTNVGISFEDMLTPMSDAKPQPAVTEEIIAVESIAKPSAQINKDSAFVERESSPAAEPSKLSAQSMALPDGYSPDKKVDENGEFYHPLMTKKKTDNQSSELSQYIEAMQNETNYSDEADINEIGTVTGNETSGIRLESMDGKEEIHGAFRSIAGNTKNIDVMIDREIGYKSKSENEINKLMQASGKNKEFLQSKGEVAKSNLPLGVIGSFLFGLIGVGCWTFVGFMLYKDLTLDSLGYIMGIFLAFSVVSGYQRMGRYLDAKGIIASFIMAVVLTFVSVSAYTGLAIFDTIRCRSDEFKNESQAVCEYVLLDEAKRTPEALERYLEKDWGEIELVEGFKYTLFYDDAYDYLVDDALISAWFPKESYTTMGKYYQDLILSFVVVAITFVLAVANAQNWKKSTKG